MLKSGDLGPTGLVVGQSGWEPKIGKTRRDREISHVCIIFYYRILFLKLHKIIFKYDNLPWQSIKILLYGDMVSDKSIIQVLSHYTSLQDRTRLLIYEVTRLTVNVETQEGEGHPIRVEEQVWVGTETRNLGL